ncbi:peroxisomal acyl-coenzyme A oxidase 3-like [Nilaparvata lugens]|uniref:peroxisomal acyl-coenzyme A oxidase 3-like n=1 Tax=Nilaparvata lugens TaxID=108931 RepID=UPI00193EBDA2|nr:peroxisomal acyl-coenzyme A oxidase 3-like [Nilaparvata lugens]
MFCNSIYRILSCLAITELAHGSDTKRMRTVAEYDPKIRQFVINTPDVGATKCWVGNLGKQCTHALLFAQLLAGDGTNHGLHLFVVPIRDPSTLLPFPGITVGDLGEKAGLHGIDNGFIMFHKYRIPRENLLNRTGDITPEGEYETSFSDPQRILGAALENLSCGRVAIMQESSNTLAKACVIAVRYAAQRTQFCDQQGIETPLIEYQLHQWRLFPYVAAAYALKFFIQQFTDQYLDCVVISKTDTAGFRDVQMMVSGVHAVVCCTKPLFTWICRNALQECREACGGHGFIKNPTDMRYVSSDISALLTQELVGKFLERSLPSEKELANSIFKTTIKPFYPLGPDGPKIEGSTPIALINRYCMSLDCDRFSTLTPFWWKEVSKKWIQ